MWNHVMKASDWGYSKQHGFVYVWEIKEKGIELSRRKDDMEITSDLINVSDWEKLDNIPKAISDFITSINKSI